jgi:hypothetical protein
MCILLHPFLVLPHIAHALRHPIRHQSLLIIQLILNLHTPHSTRATCHALMPRFDIRKPIKPVLGSDTQKPLYAIILRHKRQIRKRALIANEPLLPFQYALQYTLQYSENAAHFVLVAFDG